MKLMNLKKINDNMNKSFNQNEENNNKKMKYIKEKFDNISPTLTNEGII
jgi:hypothetical protein